MSELDMENRDPNNLNDHVKVAFEDILAEPDGAHSIDCVWKLSYSCFSGCKGLCYNIQTILCGIFIACCWGIEFAFIAFAHIWLVSPLFRMCTLNCGCAQKFCGACLNCCLAPLCEALGLFFSRITVVNKTG